MLSHSPETTNPEVRLLVPYYSQNTPEMMSRYGNSACGLTAFRMVATYWLKTDLGEKRLLQLAVSHQAFNQNLGWMHDGLIAMGRSEGLVGYRVDYTQITDAEIATTHRELAAEGANDLEQQAFDASIEFGKNHGSLADLKRLLVNGLPVITSMKAGFTGLDFSHLVTVIGFDQDQIRLNDPYNKGAGYRMKQTEFVRLWTNRAIVIAESKSLGRK